MNLLSLLSGWQIKLFLVITLVIGAYTWHKVEVNKAVDKAVTQVVADIEMQANRERFKLKERSLNTQIELQVKVDKIQKDKDNEITALKSRVRTLSDSLRSRPTDRQEPNGVPDNSGNQETKTGATGLQLSRPDAVMALWFAGEAAELQVELKSCLKQYEDVKETLDNFKKNNTK